MLRLVLAVNEDLSFSVAARVLVVVLVLVVVAVDTENIAVESK